MRPHDHERALTGAVIPFAPRKTDEGPQVSTIVALVAVSVLHNQDETVEDKLADLIEQSGQAEIIEVSDAFGEGGVYEASDALPPIPSASNDNSLTSVKR